MSNRRYKTRRKAAKALRRLERQRRPVAEGFAYGLKRAGYERGYQPGDMLMSPGGFDAYTQDLGRLKAQAMYPWHGRFNEGDLR